MNPDTINQPTGVSQSPMPSPAPEKSGMGGVVVLVIIVLILLAGGYFLMQRMGGSAMPTETMPPVAEDTRMGAPSMAEGNATVDSNTVQGTSIDLSEIEKDLNATDLDSLSADVNAI